MLPLMFKTSYINDIFCPQLIMDQWHGGLPSHQTLTEYLTPKTRSTNNKTCRFQYSVSGNVQRIKLATNSKTIKIQQGCLYNLQAMNLTPQYFTNLLKPVADTHNRKLRSSVTGAFAVPRSRSSLFDRSYSYTAPKLWNSNPIPISNKF